MSSTFWTAVWPILASLIATGIGASAVWLINRKRQDDHITNEIEGIRNEIKDIKAQVANGFKEEALERQQIIYSLRRVTDRQEGLSEEIFNIKQASDPIIKNYRKASRQSENAQHMYPTRSSDVEGFPFK